MFRHILVPLDGSATAERGLQQAIRLATAHPSSILLLHVIDDFPTMREFASYELLAQEQEARANVPAAMLAAAVQQAAQAGVTAASRVAFAVLDLPDTIVDIASKEHCELIVLGTHGRRGLARAVIGSVAEGVARRSPVPVMLVPPAAGTVAETATAGRPPAHRSIA
ncbi:universal stress protein [Aquincola sp. S2]|uniref:Universal stress protein n=1 Tax=Pseudaquabacterium terrae TaxID=2732868 RepID=A0ABX2ER91_9BURK|nr:universal stress protein [Aquabacterium terrae]NRF70974.1 universal stress protein [Aquabacterium terrae]